MLEGFLKVADVGELERGKMKQINVDGRRLLLANVDGHFYVVDDTCSHEDASLAKGSLKGELLKCPLHGSRFNVRTGEVLEDPAEENLRTYPVRVEGSSILIQIEKFQ
jgi:3-phenylpropionate/trans-cinnamate dioxygenase ferredoxin subunit